MLKRTWRSIKGDTTSPKLHHHQWLRLSLLMKTKTPRELARQGPAYLPPRWRQRPLTLHHHLRQAARTFPNKRMPPFDRHFFEREQPSTSCPLTAGILNSLKWSTMSGRTSLISLMHAAIISRPVKRRKQLSKLWQQLSLEDPTSTKWLHTSSNWPLSPSELARLRTSASKLQQDLRRLLTSPTELEL